MNKAKVYVTKFQPDWDFSPATKFGEVVFLTEDEMHPEPTMQAHNERITQEMADNLADYRCGVDCIVMTASATNNFKVANLLYEKGDGHNILRWNNKKKNYDLYKL